MAVQDTNGISSRSHKTSVTDDKRASNTALTKIKDLTKTLRKNSKEEDPENKSVVAPRNSLNMFSDRKPMSNLNNSKTSINSSTRSLQKDSPRTARRATTSTLGNYQVPQFQHIILRYFYYINT